jgi:1-acyl-sn-glycerol-3-phosphate acyltransferase
MPEGNPPGGPDTGDDRQRARLRVYRGGARPAPSQPHSPREVARRLAALERRVERALAGADARGGGERLRLVVDRTFSALATARRLSAHDVRLAAEGWTMVARDVERDLARALLDVLYRWWWRVEPVGLDRVPPTGPVVVVANRGGALVPYEALMIQAALAIAQPARRRARPVVDDWLARLPVLGATLRATGAIRAGTVRRHLGAGEAVVVCPEAGPPKTFRQRYRLAPFGRAPFARIAIETGTPIVPVAVIGSEESEPVLARIDVGGRLLGLPPVPITPTFPWLGVAGLVPLPTKWLLLVGEPLDVAAQHAASVARDAAAVAALREQVRERLQALVLEGLRRRRSVFRG